jgi:DNA-binding NtrC family response regulator
MAGQGLLLPDLAFRLSAIRFGIPPLRQRREDIAPLDQFLLDRLCARYQQRPVVLGPGTLARLLQHSWPGNVRELQGTLENALLEADNGVIRPIDLALPDGPQPYFDLQSSAHSPLGTAMGPGAGFGASGFETGMGAQAANLSLDAIIRHHVEYVLELNRGNKLRTARQLQISRSTLYRILANENFLAR